MTYDRECTEAAERIFLRVSAHLLSIRKAFNLPAIDCAIHDENESLLEALDAGDPMEVETHLWNLDHEDEDEDDE